jgi:glycerol uptake facilitator-like aquaporin
VGIPDKLRPLVLALMAEVIGTALLKIFVGGASAIYAGIYLSMAVLAGGTVSLGTYNWGMAGLAATLKRPDGKRVLPLKMLPLWWAAAFGGGCLGLWLMQRGGVQLGPHLGAPQFNTRAGTGPYIGAVLEFIGAALLGGCWMIGQQLNPRWPKSVKLVLSAVGIGAALALAIKLLGPLTSAGINPAIYLPSMLFSGYWHDWYYYVVPDVIGTIVGGQFVKLLMQKSDADALAD